MNPSLPPALLGILLGGCATTVRAFALGTVSTATFLPSSSTVATRSCSNDVLRNTAGVGGGRGTPLRLSAERPFNTWTFDKHCETMDWTPAPDVSLTAEAAPAEELSRAFDETDLVIVGVFAPAADDDGEEEEEGEPGPLVLTGAAQDLDAALGGALTDLAAENAEAFRNGGTAGAVTPAARVHVDGRARRYVLLGLGAAPTDGVAPAAATKAGDAVASACHDQKKIAACGVLLPPGAAGGGDAFLRGFSTAFHAGLYADNRYRTGKRVAPRAGDVRTVRLFLEGDGGAAADALATGARLAQGMALTRDIVNAPHNVLNSESLAATARRIAEESGGCLSCEVLGAEECEARGMGAYLGVARGSETAPQFIHLTYRPPDGGEVKKKIGIVGKGLLYDTGGYNIKTANMELMKFDCGGAAAVLGAARAVGDIQPPGVEAHFVVAACENMINERAVVPSDILTASNGKTIEVLNTDAEGRLTLADALVFADKECGCESIIELSTLTGACMIALGKQICGVWTADDALAAELAAVSEATGDKAWRMPLPEEYKEQLKSKIADMTNLGAPYGGAITAALFLTEFVDKKKPYAHIDIAGPVWDDKSGATGFGAKLVTEWVRKQGE